MLTFSPSSTSKKLKHDDKKFASLNIVNRSLNNIASLNIVNRSLNNNHANIVEKSESLEQPSIHQPHEKT